MNASKKEEALRRVVCDLYAELQSGNKVAGRLNCSRKTVYRLLHQAGIELPDRHSVEIQERKKKLHGDIAAAVAADYAAGVPVAEIKRKYGVGRYAIVTAATDAGFPVRDRGQQPRGFTDAQKAEMVELYQTGVSQTAISARFHTSAGTVSRILRGNGVDVLMRAGNKGERHGSWKGGRITDAQGYIRVWLDPKDEMAVMRDAIGYVAEHRLVMARQLGRPLFPHEKVHHRNGIKLDNKPSNLELWIKGHPSGGRVEDLIKFVACFYPVEAVRELTKLTTLPFTLTFHGTTAPRCKDCGSFHVVPLEEELVELAEPS